MKTIKFFCVCPCGSTDWLVEGANGNSTDELRADGETKSTLEVEDDEVNVGDLVGVYCCECDRILKPIWFGEVNKKERQRIFKMSRAEKSSWAESWEILKEMDKDKIIEALRKI